jgi:hypothetical protein
MSETIRYRPLAEPGAAAVTFLPKMTEHPGAGRRQLDHAEVVAGGEVGVEPPTQAAIETLGAVDVRNRDDDDLEPHVDCSCSRGLDRSFAARRSAAHVQLLRFGLLESGDARRGHVGR